MPTKKTEPDPRIDKRCVTMTNYVVVKTDKGPEIYTHEAKDYVGPEYLDAYLAVANQLNPDTGLPKWESVEVSDESDAGPGGYHGETNIPFDLDHPLAGTKRPATKKD